MSGTALGFATQERACPHTTLRFEEMGGCAFRYCLDCGKTHALWQFADHSFGLIEVPEFGPGVWEQVRREQGKEQGKEEPEAAKEEKPEPTPEPKKKKPRIVASLSPVVLKGETHADIPQDLPQVQTGA